MVGLRSHESPYDSAVEYYYDGDTLIDIFNDCQYILCSTITEDNEPNTFSLNLKTLTPGPIPMDYAIYKVNNFEVIYT